MKTSLWIIVALQIVIWLTIIELRVSQIRSQAAERASAMKLVDELMALSAESNAQAERQLEELLREAEGAIQASRSDSTQRDDEMRKEFEKKLDESRERVRKSFEDFRRQLEDQNAEPNAAPTEQLNF